MSDPDSLEEPKDFVYDEPNELIDECNWIPACLIMIGLIAILGLFLWLFIESQTLTAWECRPTSQINQPSTPLGELYVR